jgi:hypothetical protein
MKKIKIDKKPYEKVVTLDDVSKAEKNHKSEVYR